MRAACFPHILRPSGATPRNRPLPAAVTSNFPSRQKSLSGGGFLLACALRRSHEAGGRAEPLGPSEAPRWKPEAEGRMEELKETGLRESWRWD